METWFWILGWSLSILTMTGNGFVIFIVCRKRQLRTKTNAFIVSLAASDLCVGMSLVPSLFSCEMAIWCKSKGVLSEVITFILELFTYASGINLCCLVLDRYIAVAKPLTYLTFMKSRRVLQMISLSWTFSVTFTVTVSLLRYNSKTAVVRTIWNWFYVVFELSLCGIVIFCFTFMLSVVCKHDRSARRLAKQLRFNHQTLFKTQDKSAVKMMAVVVCLFLLCYVLLLRCSFFHIFVDYELPCNDRHYKTPTVLLNSAVNPLAYAIFKRDVKKEFKRLFFKKVQVIPVVSLS